MNIVIAQKEQEKANVVEAKETTIQKVHLMIYLFLSKAKKLRKKNFAHIKIR